MEGREHLSGDEDSFLIRTVYSHYVGDVCIVR